MWIVALALRQQRVFHTRYTHFNACNKTSWGAGAEFVLSILWVGFSAKKETRDKLVNFGKLRQRTILGMIPGTRVGLRGGSCRNPSSQMR